MRFDWPRRAGFSLMETMVAGTVLAFVLVALGGFIVSTMRTSNSEHDRTFATQKALQMMEEMAAYKPTGPSDPGVDRFGGGPSFALSTKDGVVPHQSLSGNPQIAGFYKYVRQISVSPVTGDQFARQVTVQIWYAAKSALPTIPAGTRPLAVVSNVLRSTVGTVGPHQVLDLYILSIENMPHVMRKDDGNQYNVSATEARLAFEAGLLDVMTMNPGLEFRKHYISRLSVGRDSYYRPHMNEAAGLDVANGGSGTRDPIPYVYFYPGRVEGKTDSPKYYDYSLIGGNLGVNLASGDTNVGTYPIADQFNHAVRLDRELDPATGKFARPDGTLVQKPEDMSLRQFLEDLLNDTTGKYRNAIVVNLQGEMLPIVPLRNYADPAKDPGDTDAVYRERRLVTHPWKLAFPPVGASNNLSSEASEPVRLLVYPFMANGANAPGPTDNDKYVQLTEPATSARRTARVIIKGIKPYMVDSWFDPSTWDPATSEQHDVRIQVVQRVRENNAGGGANDNTQYARVVDWPRNPQFITMPSIPKHPINSFPHSGPHASSHDNDSDHHGDAAGSAHGSDPTWSGNDLVITLSDLDYDARRVIDGSWTGGIDTSDPDLLLHGLQYFPDPYLPFLDKSTGTKPRNTARAIIEFNLGTTAAGKRFEVVTELMKSDGTWPSSSADPARSRTWFNMQASPSDWDGTKKLYGSIPRTEQLQLMGDPRHNPYADVRRQGLYNPYFSDFTQGKEVYKGIKNDDVTDASRYVGGPNPLLYLGDKPTTAAFLGDINTEYPNTTTDWAHTKINAPAYFQLWRDALVRNNMIFVNPWGEPARFLGLGGEFALQHKVDDLGDLHISKAPYNTDATQDANAESDELFGDKSPWIEATTGTPKWHALPWLGELYPSARFTSDWSVRGNLPTTGFVRQKLGDLAWWSFNTDKGSDKNRKKVDNNQGLPSFLNADSGGGTPPDLDEGGHNGDRTNTGNTVIKALRVATANRASTPYGYKLSGGPNTPEWSLAPYSALRLGVSWLDSPYTSSGYYTQDQGGGYYSLNPLVVQEAGGSRKAIVMADTLKPQNSTDAPVLAKIVASHLVTTFFDGIRNGLGAYNIKPVPRAKLKSPATGQSCSIATGSVSLSWYTKYVKADSQPFSPLFTYDPTLSDTSGGPLPIVYFIKYKNLTTNGPWTTARTASTSAITVDDAGVTVDAGLPVTAAAVPPIAAQAYPTPNMATWNIGGLTPGQYLLRIEAFRKSGTNVVPTHYAYHEIPVNLTP